MSRKQKRGRQSEQYTQRRGPNSPGPEVIDVERNIVERWLIEIKHWFQSGPNWARYAFYSVVGSAILALLVVIIHAVAQRTHIEQYYDLLDEHQQVMNLPEGETRTQELKSLAQDASNLCNQLWPTSESKNGCLLAAALYTETNNYTNAYKALQSYREHHNKEAFGPVAAFYAGYNAEAAEKLSKAKEEYGHLGNFTKNLNRSSGMHLYHLGRIAYYNSDYDEASRLFNQLLEEQALGRYKQQAKNYLKLIALARSKQ